MPCPQAALLCVYVSAAIAMGAAFTHLPHGHGRVRNGRGVCVSMTIGKCIFVRHGEATWNQENRFIGWTDVPLTERGFSEAKMAAQALLESGEGIDTVYTSYLKRAIQSTQAILTEMDMLWLPVVNHWRLNERMYGDLVGKNKKEAVVKFGEENIRFWRRSFDIAPPPIDIENPLWPGHDPKYAALDRSQIPRTECLKDTLIRALPYWERVMLPEILEGRTILFVGHANVMRALLKHLDNIPNDVIMGLNIPRAIPLVYEFNNGQVVPLNTNTSAALRGRYMADEATLARLLAFEEGQIKV